jgi:hypothetical protein
MVCDKNASSESVTCSAGDDNVVLHCRLGGAISGRVIDAKTHDACRGKVFVSQQGTQYFHMPSTGSDGTFRTEGLEPGTYAVAASTDDGRTGVLRGVELAPGTEAKDLVVEVSLGGHVRIRNDCKSRILSVTVQSGDIAVDSDGIEPGTAKTFTAPAGHLTLRVWLHPPPEEQKRELDLNAGEEKEVVFADDR